MTSCNPQATQILLQKFILANNEEITALYAENSLVPNGSKHKGPVIGKVCACHDVLMVTSYGVTVYPKKYAHGFVVLCFVVVMQSFIMNSHEVFIHIHQGCFAGTGAIVRLPQCQWSKPDGYGKISQCITTTKHSKAKTVCIFLGIYCIPPLLDVKQKGQKFHI